MISIKTLILRTKLNKKPAKSCILLKPKKGFNIIPNSTSK